MKRYLGFVCLIYSAIIIYVWSSDLLKNYLAINMQLYIKISAIVFIVLGIVLIFSKHIEYKFKISDLVLLFPVLILILCGDSRLGASLAQNRVNNVSNNQRVEAKGEDILEVIVEEDSYDFSKVDFNVIDESYVDLANYITFAPNAKKYSGKTIRVRGFIMDDKSLVMDGFKAIGKYNITCCAADALFVGFYIKDNGNLQSNKWYEIEGVLIDAVDKENYETLAIKPINVKEINESDEEQFVYPCYSYDDGLCKEVEKYDLVY